MGWGRKAASEEQGLTAQRNDLPRKRAQAPLVEFSERKLDKTYRQIHLKGSCLIAKQLE